ncbi:zf-HC2 domain-containing protein [Corallococcus exiguus]|uniref:zf-HC2 domain-containing protein n=1 Tax=Corallococcus TaxID=83461 RepID=UPI000EC0DB50|nr:MULTISPECIES: zf-HC2 domain-containing protein [Corallococcus]NRD64682.1 zf-HC2 domain-containing protein [Corallococcus exiguus]RKH98537.1 zf-HC2 domain-containing protein [Corallococcus sp. AB030]RUO90232.1 zf-HC2 domain-containing protein [Corallococcus sp. AB018]
MDLWCKKLYRFLDGELESGDEEHFRLHLALCRACASGLHDAMQLEMLSVQALCGAVAHNDAPPPPAPLRGPFRFALPRGRWRHAMGAVLAMGLGALTAVMTGDGFRPKDAWRADASARELEARIAYPAADRYLPYVPVRTGAGGGVALATEPPVPLRTLAALEERGDLHGIAAAYLVRGELRQASDFLSRSAPSLDRDSDRAVVAMAAGDSRGALGLLEGVLRQAPDHPQALWNRALVLRAMGLPLQAAEAFEAVARRGEPGWSEEAGIRALALRQGGAFLK